MPFTPPFDSLTTFFTWMSAVNHAEGTRFNDVAGRTLDQVKHMQQSGQAVTAASPVWRELDNFLAPYVANAIKVQRIKDAITDGNAARIVLELAAEQTGGPIITRYQGYVVAW
jgi:hypothetical protein